MGAPAGGSATAATAPTPPRASPSCARGSRAAAPSPRSSAPPHTLASARYLVGPCWHPRHPQPHPYSQVGPQPALRYRRRWRWHLHHRGHHRAVRGAQGKRHHLAKVRRRHRSARSLARHPPRPSPPFLAATCSLSSSIMCTYIISVIYRTICGPVSDPLPALTASKATILTKRESGPSKRRSRALLPTCTSRTSFVATEGTPERLSALPHSEAPYCPS